MSTQTNAQTVQLLTDIYKQGQISSVEQREFLASILKAEKIGALESLQSSETEQSIERYTAIRFWALVSLIAGVTIYLTTIYLTIRSKYAFLIDQVGIASRLKVGAYTFTTGFFIALAYEYPILSTLKFTNSGFPAAVVYSYYTDRYSQQIVNNPALLQAMFDWSEKNNNAPAQQIMCSVIGRAAGIPGCLPACPGPTNISLGTYIGSAVGMAGQGAFIGNLIPGVGPIAGLALGAVFGVGLAWLNGQSNKSQCGNNPECITPTGGVQYC